jgi:hypothetical protein
MTGAPCERSSNRPSSTMYRPSSLLVMITSSRRQLDSTDVSSDEGVDIVEFTTPHAAGYGQGIRVRT